MISMLIALGCGTRKRIKDAKLEEVQENISILDKSIEKQKTINKIYRQIQEEERKVGDTVVTKRVIKEYKEEEEEKQKDSNVKIDSKKDNKTKEKKTEVDRDGTIFGLIVVGVVALFVIIATKLK